MLPLKLDHLSSYTKKEVEKLQTDLAPLVKRSAILTFISFSMLSIAIVNLFLFIFGMGNNDFVIIFAFSLLGALGMALYKETIYKNKEIQTTSIEYIKKRMVKSTLVPEDTKDQYIEKVNKDPMTAFQTFCDFLSKEERIRRVEDSN
ncbi:DUF5392 family protein [Evansella halocellulosilytica]|uniref:DUF5392 family protein n=1 Tax=Evansella halocellulosilytica TaxID=2011013 RepID=UPI000BB7D918|nr:DUF5392 family protein [Evansella halocellulosilytica]